MNAMDYMTKQILKHTLNLERAQNCKNTPEEHIENIKRKIGYYQEAVKALRSV